jgi:Tol biopolymer transport system component
VIVCVAGRNDAAGRVHQLVAIEVGNGAVKPIGSDRWYQIKRLAWLADGSGLVMPAASQVSEYLYQQIWYISYPEGEARKITNDLNNYVGMGLTADSKSLVTVQFATISNIWTAPNGDASRAKQLPSGGHTSDGIDGVVWTPDGKIVYRTAASGNEDIWMMEADGSGQRQLTAQQRANYSPAVSGDGRYVVFVSDRGGSEQIWRMNIDGSDLRQLTTEGGASPHCSPDGRWVVYDANATLWRIRIDGGQPLQLTTNLTSDAAISPDGKQVACFYRVSGLAPFQIAILPSEGGQPLKVFDVAKNIVRWPGLRWTIDGRSVIYVDSSGGVSNLWSQPIDGGTPKQLTDFKSDSIFSYDWSRDGRQLVLARGTETNDVIVIRDSK